MKPVFEIVTEEDDQTPTVMAEFRGDLERMSRKHLDRFFKGKRLPNGSPVPTTLLHTRENYDALLDMEGEFPERVDLVYKELGTLDTREMLSPNEHLAWDVQFVLNSLKECARMKIPKPLAAGIVLIYARLCQPYQSLRKAN